MPTFCVFIQYLNIPGYRYCRNWPAFSIFFYIARCPSRPVPQRSDLQATHNTRLTSLSTGSSWASNYCKPRVDEYLLVQVLCITPTYSTLFPLTVFFPPPKAIIISSHLPTFKAFFAAHHGVSRTRRFIFQWTLAKYYGGCGE